MPSGVGKVPGSGLSPPPGSPPHCPIPLSESLCWPEMGKSLGRRAERSVWAPGASGEGREWGAVGVRSGLTPKASFGKSRVARRGRPGSGWLCRPAQAAARRSWSEGPALSLLSSSSPGPSCSQGDPGSQTGWAGTAGCWQPLELTPLWASLLPAPSHFGGKAAGRPLIGPAGEGGGVEPGGWTRASVFNFSFFPPLFLSPKFLVFLPLFPLLAPSRRLLSQDVRGCLEIPQPTPAAESLLLKSAPAPLA